MKKQGLLFATFLFLSLTFFGQTNLPNGGMENWHTVTQGSFSYIQIDGPFFSTLNELSAVPPPIGPGPTTVFQVTDAHTGTYAAKLTSANFVMIPSDIFIPGMMGSTQLDMINGTIKLGKPCPGCKPTKFYGWYKFDQVNGDSCAAVLLASHWNAATGKKDTVGYCKTVFTQPVSQYTYFEMPVQYFTTGVEPDSLLVLCVSSGGFAVLNLQGSVGQVGNTMFVDDLSIDYPLGITQKLMPEIGVRTYPNPAREQITVELTKQLPNALFEVYSMDGKFLRSFPLKALSNQVPVYSLETGKYYYQLTDGKTIQNTGFFTVIK